MDFKQLCEIITEKLYSYHLLIQKKYELKLVVSFEWFAQICGMRKVNYNG